MARVVLYMVCILPYLVALCAALPGLRRVLYTCVARGSARCAERHLFTTAVLGWRGHRTAAAVPSGQRVCCPAAAAAVAAVDWGGCRRRAYYQREQQMHRVPPFCVPCCLSHRPFVCWPSTPVRVECCAWAVLAPAAPNGMTQPATIVSYGM